ncbi:uncharacterized protein ARMOST_15864 [Armillaria ostoyae]|uniref:Uncharacterized protein n=1 Tax=Armillaria ostoyae TaxID=47428 RepID=A0A284RUM3_ARMOS|nr:uncharacterized protein ARMOST_15864 [Armillaria ostoyae]
MQIVSERGGNTREVGSIGEHFMLLPNSSDVDASRPQDPDFALRRVSSGCDGRSGKEDDRGHWQCSFRVARVRLTLESPTMSTSLPKPVFTSGQRIVVLRARSAPGADRTRGIQGDGGNRGDGDEDVQVTYPSTVLSDIRTVTIRAEPGESMLDVMQTFKIPHHEVLASVAVGKHAVLCGHTNTEGGSRLPPSVDEPEIILVFQQSGPTKMMF